MHIHASKKKKCWAILGGGNGGQALAGHLSLMGFTTRLYSSAEATVQGIKEQGGVYLQGAVEGFGKVEHVSSCLETVLEGADHIMVTTAAVAHASLAKRCAALVKDGQHIILHPGSHFGAIEFKSVLDKEGCTADVTISETNSLIYACRAKEIGRVHIFGIKAQLLMGTLPAIKRDKAIELVQELFAQILPAKNVIESSLANTNAILHPGTSLLCTALIESGNDWEFYKQGFTPSIGAFMERLDQERMALCKAFAIDMENIIAWCASVYGVEAQSLSEAMANNPSYAGLMGQKRLDTRYVTEGIPMGLIPMIELGTLAGVKTPHMEVIVNLAMLLLPPEKFPPARTFENLGLSGISYAQFIHYVESGQKPQS